MQADCLALLPLLSRVDQVITDPPYDERTHSNAKSTAHKSGTVDFGFDHLQSLSFVGDLLRLSRGWVVCFCALEDLGQYRDAAKAGWVRSGIWNRLAGTAFARPDRPFQGAEGIAIMSTAEVKRFPAGAKRAVWDDTTARDDRVHPTQKPVTLMMDLLRDFTSPNDLILDPFAGSGTTGVAALRLGRRCILIEKDPKYTAICVERMRAEESGSTLQAQRAGQVPMFG